MLNCANLETDRRDLSSSVDSQVRITMLMLKIIQKFLFYGRFITLIDNCFFLFSRKRKKQTTIRSNEKGLDCRLQSRWKTLEHAEDESRKEYIIDFVMLI